MGMVFAGRGMVGGGGWGGGGVGFSAKKRTHRTKRCIMGYMNAFLNLKIIFERRKRQVDGSSPFWQ